MNRVYLLSFLIIPTLLNANPIKKENLSPNIEEPMMPGTKIPINELNTAPAPTPGDNQSDKFRGTLKGKPQEQVEKNKTDETKTQNRGHVSDPD